MCCDGGGGWRRRMAGWRSRSALTNGSRPSFSAATANHPVLKPHEVVAEQPRLTLQLADERRQVTRMHRCRDLLHDEHLPQSDGCGLPGDLANVFGWRVDQGLDEGESADASIDLLAELGIEGDRSFEQE